MGGELFSVILCRYEGEKRLNIICKGLDLEVYRIMLKWIDLEGRDVVYTRRLYIFLYISDICTMGWTIVSPGFTGIICCWIVADINWYYKLCFICICCFIYYICIPPIEMGFSEPWGFISKLDSDEFSDSDDTPSYHLRNSCLYFAQASKCLLCLVPGPLTNRSVYKVQPFTLHTISLSNDSF